MSGDFGILQFLKCFCLCASFNVLERLDSRLYRCFDLFSSMLVFGRGSLKVSERAARVRAEVSFKDSFGAFGVSSCQFVSVQKKSAHFLRTLRRTVFRCPSFHSCLGRRRICTLFQSSFFSPSRCLSFQRGRNSFFRSFAEKKSV